MTAYSVTIPGRAYPQGSKKAFVNPKTNRAIMVESSGANHKAWRKLVTATARTAPHRPLETLTVPVEVSIRFSFQRPKTHYFQRKSGDVLRPDAPVWVSSRGVGDLDKLERSVYDALTDAEWLADDSLIAKSQSCKAWTGDGDRVWIYVSLLPDSGGTLA